MYDIPPNATLRRRIRADPKEFRHSRETNIVDTPTQDIYDTPVQHDVEKVRIKLMYSVREILRGPRLLSLICFAV